MKSKQSLEKRIGAAWLLKAVAEKVGVSKSSWQ